MATFKQYELKNGNKKWLFKTYVGIDKVTLKQVTTTRRGFNSKKEAVLAERRLQNEIIKNGGLEKTQIDTFGEITEMWLMNYKQTVAASSYSKVWLLFKNQILRDFGNLQINNINTAYCQKMVLKWSTEISRAKYKLALNYTQKIFKYAISLGITEYNPALNVIVPKVDIVRKSNRPKFYELHEIKKILDTIEQDSDEYSRYKYYALFRLLAFSGCRIGEVLALSWDDLDLVNHTIAISKTVARGETLYISNTPKTKKSNRVLPLDELTILAIRKWRKQQNEFLLLNGFTKSNFIFTNFDNAFHSSSDINIKLNRYQKKCGMQKTGLHIFRHSHASALLKAGASLKEVSERLGHSTVNFTADTYIHLTDSDKKDTMKKFADFANF